LLLRLLDLLRWVRRWCLLLPSDRRCPPSRVCRCGGVLYVLYGEGVQRRLSCERDAPLTPRFVLYFQSLALFTLPSGGLLLLLCAHSDLGAGCAAAVRVLVGRRGRGLGCATLCLRLMWWDLWERLDGLLEDRSWRRS
jgi:hypothetical protein